MKDATPGKSILEDLEKRVDDIENSLNWHSLAIRILLILMVLDNIVLAVLICR